MSLKDTDVRTPGDAAIAKKFNLSLARVRQLVKQGAKHEKEHNTNLAKAEEVARDHIAERPDYYKMLKKAEKTPVTMKEESGIAGVRGLGYVSGDPAGELSGVDKYINSNAMAYEDENGNKLEYIRKQHVNLHNKGLGYNFFDPTNIKGSFNFMNEATTTSGAMGGRHSPKEEEGDKYLENNVKNAEKDLSIREKHADENHHKHHVYMGFNAFKHTNVKDHSNRELAEGISAGPERTQDYSIGDAGGGRTIYRKGEMEEGAKLDKAKKAVMAGLTAANIYTAGDVASKAAEGRGSPKADVVRMASTLPGAAGWAATGVHYAKKAYDKVKQMKEDKDPCWKGYEMVGMKKKGGKKVPNCVPVSEQGSSATPYTERPTYEGNDKYPQAAERGIYQEDWQDVNRKDKTDGLSQKAVNAYRREHPGSKLKTAVTEKNPTGKRASRRKSFCSRMGGMKKRLTSAKTARDPDSRINKALRRWNCEEGYASIGHAYDWTGDVNSKAKFYGDKPKATTTKNDEKDDTYKDSNKGKKVKFAKTVKEGYSTYSGKSHSLSPLGKSPSDPLKNKRGADRTLGQYTRDFPANYAKKKISKELGDVKSSIKSNLGKHTKPKHLPEAQIDELKAETLGSYVKKASASRKEALKGSKADIKTWGKRQKGITTAIKQLTKENSKDKDWDEATGPMGKSPVAEQTPSHLHSNKPDTKYAPGATGTTHTIHEDTKMENKDLINEAIENILENNLIDMKENFKTALEEKAMEKLEERKKEIAAEYFAQ